MSYDTPEKNLKFAQKNRLPFLLLSDTDRSLAEKIGAARLLIPVPKRISYLVGVDGKVLKAYSSVSPSEHASQVLEDFRSLNQE